MQQTTIHITRRKALAGRYQVWRGDKAIIAEDALSKARSAAARIAKRHGYTEMTECWATGKTFELTSRGAWRQVS